MTFTVKVHKQVKKKLKELPNVHRRCFLELKDILHYEAVPRDKYDIIKLEGTGNIDIYRIRLGSYRIIYSVNWKERLIMIHRLKTREDAYK